MVSLSNHAFGVIPNIPTMRLFPRRARFDKFTTNGVRKIRDERP